MESKSRSYIKKRNRSRLLKVLLGLGALCAAIVADKAGLLPRKNSDDYAIYNQVRARVVKVVDGDTLDIDIPDTASGYKTTRLRLMGIDTPETKRPDTPVQHFGPQAANRTRQLAMGQTVTVTLPSKNRTRGNYGRLLAYLVLPDGKMLNRQLVTEGMAYADPRYQHPHMDDFRSEMSIARRRKAGLWRDVQDSDLPYYLQN